MAWFKRAKEGIKPQKKKDLPNLWVKCQGCEEIIYKRELEKNLHVCPKCEFHFRISSSDYVDLLLDNGHFEEFNTNMAPVDFLKFKAIKKYSDQLKDGHKKTGRHDAIRTGFGSVHGHKVVFCVMDFAFIGGSMGSVVGEKIARGIDEALNRKLSLIILSTSGGARMQEGIISLMQMAKTSARLARLSDRGLLHIALLTNPTMGGVTASFAMLGDVILAEPGAFIGFAGPRVIKQTIGQDLPDGFQNSEFQLKHGFVDAVVRRHELKDKLKLILDFATDKEVELESTNGSLEQGHQHQVVDEVVEINSFEDEAAKN